MCKLVLSESWLNDQPSLLSVCVSTQRQMESEEKADDDQDQESDDSDCQDVQVEDSPESEHSCHNPSHMMSTLSPPIFGDLSAPEVVSH